MDKRDNKAVNIHTFNDYRGYQKYRGVLTIEQMSRAHQELKDGIKNIQDKDEKKKTEQEYKIFLEYSEQYMQARLATVYKGNIIKNLIMDCQSYTKYRPNETTGGIFVSWRRKEELPTGA